MYAGTDVNVGSWGRIRTSILRPADGNSVFMALGGGA